MSNLPKIEHPIVTINIPSKNKEAKFRPFLVKEEKILLMAKESKKYSDIMMSLVQVLSNCLNSSEKINIEDLTTYDVEYMFLKLRAASVGNIVPQSYVDNEDKTTYTFNVNLDEVKVIYPEGHEKRIKINDEMSILLKDPVLKESLFIQPTGVDTLIEMIKDCLDSVYVKDEIFSFKDYDAKEIDEFVDSMPPSVLEQFQTFFFTMPRLNHELHYTNKNGKERVVILSTLEDFFSLR